MFRMVEIIGTKPSSYPNEVRVLAKKEKVIKGAKEPRRMRNFDT